MGIINGFFGAILNIIFEIISSITPVGILGVSIIMFTLVAQLLLTPIKFKQLRTTRMMSKLQPEMQKLQKKYANKKDQASQMEYSKEMQALYKKYNVSPLAGCLPLLIQLPLIMGLYNVLQQPTRYIEKLGALYTELATVISSYVTDAKGIIDQVIAQIPLSSNAQVELQQLGDTAQVSDIIAHFTTGQWELLQQSIPVEGVQALESLLAQKHNIEYFLVNLVDSPSNIFATDPFLGIIVPILAGGSTFIFNKVIMSNQTPAQPNADGVPSSAETMMKTMNIMMPLMMAFFSWTVPSGLALYWISGNLIMMVQQTIVNKIVDKQQAAFEEQLRKDREAEEAAKKKKKKKKKVKPIEETVKEIEVEIDKEKIEQAENKLEPQSTKESSEEKQD